MENELIEVNAPLTASQIKGQVNLIQEVMKSVMQEGQHYGKIPGCGDKPTLLKPGAEKLSMTFRLRPIINNDRDIRIEDLPDGHKNIHVYCHVHNMSGVEMATGIGSCSTMESKYRYRGGEKIPTGTVVPKEYWNFKKEGKLQEASESIGGKGFGIAKIESTWQVCEIGEKMENPDIADTYNCVTPDTKVLTHDLQWVPVGEIETGDMLIGVSEDMPDQYGRNIVVGEAVIHGRKVDELYEIVFDDGRIVRCNAEHKWLVKKVGLKGTEWVATEEIYKEIIERDGRPRNWSVMSLCRPWIEDISKEAGYIAGLLDADGSLGITQLVVMFAQQDNVVLSLLEQGLIERGYRLSKKSESIRREDLEKRKSQKQVYSVRILGGFSEQLRLIGSIRPPRLIDRWINLFDLSKRRLEGHAVGDSKPSSVISIRTIGKGEIVLLGTSSHTYLAEGLVCHNTVLKMAKKRAYVDGILSATAASDIFTQDIEDFPESMKPETAVNASGKPDVQMPKELTKEVEKVQPAQNPPQEKGITNGVVISEAQGRRLFAIRKTVGYPDKDFKEYLQWSFQIDSDRKILRSDYEAIITHVQEYKKSV